MTHLPEASAEPRRTRGGAGGAARGQWVRYPLRLVLDAEAYADADVKVYGKVRALSKGRSCEAGVEKLAGYVGLAASTVEKSLSRLSRPAPTDGITELTRRQRSHKGTGTGRTTERTCRALDAGERYVSAPVLAADTLRGTLHRLYLVLRYTEVVEKRQLTLAEMGHALRHRTGTPAGQALADAVADDLLDELVAAGWITLTRRAGYRGRHLVEVHDHPVHPVDSPPATPELEGGVAPDLEGGALAYKEDHESLNDLGNHPPAVVGIRRRRPTATSARDRDAELLDTFGRRRGLDLTAAAWTTVYAVLAPVAHELPLLTAFEWERLVGTVLARLAECRTPDRLRDRLQRRYDRMRPAGTPDDGRPAIRQTGRWLIGAALTRHGCTDPACESGTTWPSGEDCPVCVLHRERTAARARREAELAAWVAEMEARPRHRPAQRLPDPEPHAPPTPPLHAPPSAPTAPVGTPPGGWRALVARERPAAAAEAYRHRWKGDHAHHLDTA